jgi:hypothetical protein
LQSPKNGLIVYVKRLWLQKLSETCLLYEAEIYDPVISDKIRDRLIQHVSVGADYVALDLVDAKVPYGLSHPELSLVAVSGIEETNIKVLVHFQNKKSRINTLYFLT